jgi:CubicO group peptidase (beta-lactamase class C family)
MKAAAITIDIAKLQFQVLYREFLFRIVDIELLSPQALGDSNKLLGQFAALLIFVSLLFSLAAMGVGDSRTPPALRLFHAWTAEHFLIATTMLVVGLFSVLSWDSTFPDRRDVLMLAPLPVRPSTWFLAKAAATATALGLSVVLLHALAGFAWPLALGIQGTVQVRMPELGYLPAIPPVNAAGIDSLMKRDLVPALSSETGITIGVFKRGERRVFAYGTARPDSIYQIASISKTFTGLLLAQMAVDGAVRLDQPLRELLPAGTVRPSDSREITLADLATHRSGLPPIPDNVNRNATPNPGAGYKVSDLYAFLARRGVSRPANPPFIYSNAGFSVLGQALAAHAGETYGDLVARQITAPLGMLDTAIVLSPEQNRRLIQGYSVRHEPRPAWEIGALAPAGGIYSTAGDLLPYLEAQLHGSSPAIRLSQQLRAQLIPGTRIGLAWVFDEATGTYWHNGAISGYTSHALFNPKGEYAVVVLVNQAISLVTLADMIAQHIRQRLTGQPAISLTSVTVPSSGGLSSVARMFAAYWITMMLAGAFVYCCVLALQGFAAQLLPRRIFLRLSSLLQMIVFCIVVSVYFLQPSMATGQALIGATGHGLLSCSPSFWFLGLFQQLNGSPALNLLARRAWIALGVVFCATAIVYALSYFRTLRKVAEEPDIVGTARLRLPRFGDALQTAIVQFSIRTLLRSRRHRLILAFYLGIGFALVISLIKAPAARQQLEDALVANPWGQVNEPLLAATIAMIGFAILGTRVILSIPLDLRANWIFQITGVRRAAECLKASRRSLLVLSLAPAWLVSALICFYCWPRGAAAGHLAMLAALGLILTEISLYGFRKIPFTCSYLPGKSQVHLAVLGGLGLLWCLRLSVRHEQKILESLNSTIVAVLFLLLIGACAHLFTQLKTRSEKEEVQFDDADDPVVQGLELNRDGTWETGSTRPPPDFRSLP